MLEVLALLSSPDPRPEWVAGVERARRGRQREKSGRCSSSRAGHSRNLPPPVAATHIFTALPGVSLKL